MKTKYLVLALLLLTQYNTLKAQNLPFGFPDTERTKKTLNQGWKFKLGTPTAENFKTNLEDSTWETVSVPHTLKLTSLTLDGLDDDKMQLVFHRNVGWYRKTIYIEKSNKKVFLEFEGAHQITDLWINGIYVARHYAGGYTPFHFDITEAVNKGKNNQITLLVDNRRSEVIPPDPGPFDYVKFSGLYRDVYLVETHPVHVTFNWETLNSGVYITTPTIDPVNKNATINIKTSVKNEETKEIQVKLVTKIIDKEGLVVLKLTSNENIKPGEEHQFNQIGSLEDNVHFWDTDNPYLYRVNSTVVAEENKIDFVENKIGLRKFELDPIRGYILNNKPIKLIGFNRHQQYPYIGDAVPNSLHYKDMLQFKEYGFNIMRTAHYPQDDALIDACDELGILVYEEAPTWISMSTNDTWWDNLEKVARTMVRNHRNHTSIVMWGAGVNHRGYVPRIHNVIKQEDPIRLTASQGSRWTGWQTSGLTDINANMLYGPFIWDRSEPIFAMEGKSGAAAVAPYKKDTLMTGLISWTAHAYHTFHPTHDKAKSTIDRTRSGMMTIFRYPRPQYEWYKSELLEEPFINIKNNWIENTNEVTVFSNADEVALFLNGKQIAKNKPSKDTIYDGLDHAPFHFKNIKYKVGELVAKGYYKKGKSIKTSKQTPEKAYAIKLQLDTKGRKFTADGNDILMAYATVVDKKGTTVSNTKNLVKFSVKGDASIVGDHTNINANPMFTEYGVAPALIRAGNTAEEVAVYAKSNGLKSDSIQIKLEPHTSNYIAKKAMPIYDFTKERVDIGATDQLVQFGWNYWTGEDTKQGSYNFKLFKGVTAKLSKASAEGVNRWLGEMNVIGKYGFIYGDGVLTIDKEGVNLVFENLAKGTYKLKTWHHAPKSNSDLMDTNVDKLKLLKIHELPYAKTLKVTSDTMANASNVKVTAGKQMQWELPGTGEYIFTVDDKKPVIINFKGENNKGVWLNAFELSEWK